MKYIILFVALSLSACSSACSSAPKPIPKKEFNPVQSVFKVVNKEAMVNATAFLVRGHSGIYYVLTNAHVCRSLEHTLVLFSEENVLGTVVPSLIDEKQDICFSSVTGDIESRKSPVTGVPFKPLNVSPNFSRQKEFITYGHPYGKPLTTEKLSSVEWGDRTDCQFITTCGLGMGQIYPGDSGSPVLDTEDNVVGMIFAAATGEVGIFIPSAVLYRNLQVL